MKKLIAPLIIIIIFSSIYSLDYESRAIINSIQDARFQLQNLGVTYRGGYAFTDYMYYPSGKKLDLNKEFIRLRVYQHTCWNQKKYVIVHKIKEAGKSGKLIWNQECDSLEQAQQLLDEYGAYFLFSFSRTGTEFFWKDMRIFVEDIQGLPATIEIVAQETQPIKELFELLEAEVVYDSVAQLVFKCESHEQK